MAMVFFDLDGTLIRGPSSEKRFFMFLMRKRILRLRQLKAFLIFTLRWFPHLNANVLKENKAYLCGMSHRAIREIAEQFVPRILLPALRPDVTGRLEEHLAQGERVILLTGAPDFIAEPVAKKLGIPHVAATVCDTDKGCFTAVPPRIHPVGPAKLEIAGQICRAYNSALNHCTAYGDSANDTALLAAVSRPVAVYPDRKLRRTAVRCGWEIMG